MASLTVASLTAACLTAASLTVDDPCATTWLDIRCQSIFPSAELHRQERRPISLSRVMYHCPGVRRCYAIRR